LGSHRDRELVAFLGLDRARASDLLDAACADADPEQLVTVIRTGTRPPQESPASPYALLCLRHQGQVQAWFRSALTSRCGGHCGVLSGR